MSVSNPVNPLPSRRPALLLFILTGLAVTQTGCFGLLGGGGASKRTIAATDSAEAYAEFLSVNPNAPDAEQYRKRLAELELVELRENLKPVLSEDAAVYQAPGTEPSSRLGPTVGFIFDSYQDGWFGLRSTGLKTDPEKDAVDFFKSSAEEEIKFTTHDSGVRTFSIDKPAGIPLIRTDSFDSRIMQTAQFQGGLRFCFFSPSPDSCDEGYEFYYDRAQFREYSLKRKSKSGDTVLCSYKISASNFQHSDNITVDRSRNRAKDPDIRISAHNGYIDVLFNDVGICHKQDPTYTSGYFVVSRASGIRGFGISLNAGSEPVFVSQSDVADIRHGEDRLELREGPLYVDAYNHFVSDYDDYLTFLKDGTVPSKGFHNAYFNAFLGKGEADEKYEAVRAQSSIDAYVAYLKEYPVNSHKKEIEEAVFNLASNENTVEGYEKYITLFPESARRFEIRQRIADVQWDGIVKNGTEAELKSYITEYPNGYHRAKAELLLKSLAYYDENRADIDRKMSVIKEAQKAVDNSPLTNSLDVMIIDYVDGNIYYNVNDGPTSRGGEGAMDVASKQKNAYYSTCELLKRKVRGIETCLTAWKMSHARPKDSIPASYAIMKAIRTFYLKPIAKNKPIYAGRLLSLLDKLLSLREQFDHLFYDEDDYRIFAAKIYALLGFENQAITALYDYASEQKSARALDISLVKGYFRNLEGNNDFQNIRRTFGGMSEQEKINYREQLERHGE